MVTASVFFAGCPIFSGYRLTKRTMHQFSGDTDQVSECRSIPILVRAISSYEEGVSIVLVLGQQRVTGVTPIAP
jgi:hypothetical protein